jgi:5-dehydro-2-deoxygluconokinase
LIGKNSFLVLGRAGMDLYADPPGMEAEHARQFTTALGGSAANIAAGIARLGGKVSLISAVSNDSVGHFVVNQLQLYGVGVEHVAKVGGERRTSLAVVETRLENCQNTIYRNSAADFELSHDQLETINWQSFAALIVTGTALALEPSRAVTLQAMKLAAQHELIVIIDLDYRPYSWTSEVDAAATLRLAAGLSDIVIGNDVEFDVMAGRPGDGQALAQKTGKLAVYKMGEKGAITFSGDTSTATGTYKVRALKPTGAGDAFMAGFVTGLARQETIATAVTHGSAAAAIVVTRVGCAPAMPTEHELQTFITQHGLLE